MKKEIKLGFNNEYKLFRGYVELLQPMFKLRSREADVFAKLLQLNYDKRDIKNLEDRFSLILSTKMRKQILEDLKIKDNVLQNTLSILRKKNMIVDNKVSAKFHIYPLNSSFDIVFKLKVQ